MGAAGNGVGEDLVGAGGAVVGHVYGRRVTPRAPGLAVARVEGDVLGRVSGRVGHLVGVELVVVAVPDEHGRAVRTDAPRPVVAGAVQVVKIIGGVAGAVGAVVGVELVGRAASAGVVHHPEGVSVAPHAAGIGVAAVQVKAGHPLRRVGDRCALDLDQVGFWSGEPAAA